ncbi:hypothetical protein VFPBJ_08053 [Purpureocillium lilacinum]|uniref:Uncharacterized protein n=1 Tax=Purpureocillium lilacinum TaxID=33203 RepID=A0A179GJP1_PURLI|nr:hypothetical protein VFPBJ_08053 [Purpureocillium lilacinum]
MRCQWGSEAIAQPVVILTLGCRASVESADGPPVGAVNFGRGVVAGSLHPSGPKSGSSTAVQMGLVGLPAAKATLAGIGSCSGGADGPSSGV